MHIKAVLRPTNLAEKVIVLITAKTQKPSLSRPTCLPYAGMYRSTQGCVCVFLRNVRIELSVSISHVYSFLHV